MTLALARISTSELLTGDVYVYAVTVGETTQDMRYPIEMLERFTTEQLEDIDVEWIDTEDPLPSYFTRVDNERDTRINAGYTFMTKNIQCRNDADWINIDMAYGRALAAILIEEALPDDYEWDVVGEDFEWITGDNTLLALDAFEMVEMGRRIGRWRTDMYQAARVLKDLRPEPADLTDDIHWPSSTDGSGPAP